jgi:tRNA(fMet)-specific endonuclease VapC
VAVIIDRSVLIAYERDAFALDAYLATIEEHDVAISAVTASELLHGVERARDPEKRAARASRIAELLDAFQVVPFGLAEARVHARIWAALSSHGKTIGAHDLIVAATALAGGASIATLNQKEFKRVPGLSLDPVARFTRK